MAKYDYLSLLARASISPIRKDEQNGQFEPLTDFITCDVTFRNEITRARGVLGRYFDDASSIQRPLNCLLLGPPGAGKTYLAQKLAQAIKPSAFFELNLAQCDDASRIAEMFREIKNQRRQTPKVVFFDEFDVTIAGTSAIRYLIQPIYSGKDYEHQELGRVAFIFSGSYLKNERILSVLQRHTSDFDFIQFLYDMYRYVDAEALERALILDFFDASVKYRDVRDKNLPERDVFDYLRRLDKLIDFLSRINGFVIEIPDISAPLEVTTDQFILREKSASCGVQLSRLYISPEEVINFVRSIEEDEKGESGNNKRYISEYSAPSEVILQFKNMLLSERFCRVLRLLAKQFPPPRNQNHWSICVQRSLLNYLTVVPLAYSMRSLEFIISGLDTDQNKRNVFLPRQFRDSEVFRMHARDEGIYRDEEVLWSRILIENRGALGDLDLLQKQTIEVEIDTGTSKGTALSSGWPRYWWNRLQIPGT